MLQFLQIAVVILVSLALPKSLLGQCDICQTEVRAACHSETSFSICYNGIPTGDYIECPKDFHCTGEKYICYPKTVSLSNCRKDSDVDVTGSSTTSIPTTKAPRDPVTLCKETQKNGQYTNELDPTCATYVQCYFDSTVDEWSGAPRKCSSNFWFNGYYCEIEKPEYCT